MQSKAPAECGRTVWLQMTSARIRSEWDAVGHFDLPHTLTLADPAWRLTYRLTSAGPC